MKICRHTTESEYLEAVFPYIIEYKAIGPVSKLLDGCMRGEKLPSYTNQTGVGLVAPDFINHFVN